METKLKLYEQLKEIDDKIITAQETVILLQKEYINYLEGLLKEQPLTSGEEQKLTNKSGFYSCGEGLIKIIRKKL